MYVDIYKMYQNGYKIKKPSLGGNLFEREPFLPRHETVCIPYRSFKNRYIAVCVFLFVSTRYYSY